ncbi:MAG: Crp/Fnr family transcriptional regulator [Gammaproteobacteria bacterium]|nr:Crp/Fnr family transcriptional regulator [Gammaproteobacteria bacterium]
MPKTVPNTSEYSNSANDIYQELKRLDLLGGTLEGLKPGIEHANHRRYDEASVIFHEGSPIDSLQIVLRGRIKLVHYMDNGNARIVRLHNKGSILGLNGLLQEAHEHTAISIDAVEAYEIPMMRLHELKNDDLKTYSQLLEFWNDYLHMADKWITDFSTGPIRSRIARLILHLADIDDVTGESQARLLTGEEMAEILGVTPESISRTIAEFKRSEILVPIEPTTEHTFQCDLELLEEIAEG